MIVLYLDGSGLLKAEITYRSERDKQEYRSLFIQLRPELEKLDEFIKKAAAAEVAEHG